jgi:endogenous inhibitor of DNA gyrase (YacG/DUF329 family)
MTIGFIWRKKMLRSNSRFVPEQPMVTNCKQAEREGLQARTVRCPACGSASVYAPSNPDRPFCSERCKQHDFGAWASESFKVEDHDVRDPSEFPDQH